MKHSFADIWQQTRAFFRTTTSRLTLSYLAIIMLMSIGFSVVFYSASSRELGRQIPPPSTFNLRQNDGQTGNFFQGGVDDSGRGAYRQFFEDRIAEGRASLRWRLAGLNLLALIGGTVLSYYLARRTLQPIERNMEAQAQFVSDASHELRTPLTAMQASNEVALRRAKITDPQAREIITSNISDVVRLRALTDGLLRLARQGNTGAKLAPVLLSDAVGEAINGAAAAASAKRITIDDQVGKISGLADKTVLAQIISILLDNAIKYSPEKSTVTISAEAKGKHALLQVTDQGIGISEADLPHVFDRFYRASAARTITTQDGGAGGYGLGLSIADKLAAQSGAGLSVKSTFKHGSTFTIHLPLIA